MNYYEVLGLTPPVTEKEIRSAYKKALLLHHPDKVKTSEKTISIDLINKAYHTLINDNEEYQKQVIFGDGLDIFNLADFEEKKIDDGVEFYMKCPRCRTESGIKLTEDDLIGGAQQENNEYEVIVQCGDCSLWIRVQYEEE
ncbi:diphthamide biosynthesis protein 4 [[Candida] jaroonii]|uniref:Diphthamide biosynthesis protein 4 n=1 Tax=[Candida] jaroonii TaxID=467808 RepID=A0ACA9Y0R9_9ASCO|nr:diphthamide biosynthesis protein 4 [[Candida] jaroonii]